MSKLALLQSLYFCCVPIWTEIHIQVKLLGICQIINGNITLFELNMMLSDMVTTEVVQLFRF